MGEFASKGLANGIGIPALVLGSLGFLQSGGLNGGLGGLLGGNNAAVAGGMALNAMAEKDAIIAQLKSEKYTDQQIASVYKANRDEKDALGDRLLDKYINPMAQEISNMRVREAETTAAINCLSQSTSQRFESVYKEIECAKKECGSAIALEGERRINGDNSIMCYVQGNYVQGKLVMPADAICPEVMRRWNSWTAPTNTAPDTQTVNGNVDTK